ncbi:MAG: fluoride efflux transporter CrcB [Saprospiraceae bacterium]
MQALLIVGAGSFVGGMLRYGISKWVQVKLLTTYPFGTFTVNIVGCLIIGLLMGMSERYNISSEWRLLLVTGFCGGFTTFSAFSIETMALLRDAQYLPAFLYIAGSVIIGVLAAFAGYSIHRFI